MEGSACVSHLWLAKRHAAWVDPESIARLIAVEILYSVVTISIQLTYTVLSIILPSLCVLDICCCGTNTRLRFILPALFVLDIWRRTFDDDDDDDDDDDEEDDDDDADYDDDDDDDDGDDEDDDDD
eukprot:5232592-Karenia_brevis.AAC.1